MKARSLISPSKYFFSPKALGAHLNHRNLHAIFLGCLISFGLLSKSYAAEKLELPLVIHQDLEITEVIFRKFEYQKSSVRSCKITFNQALEESKSYNHQGFQVKFDGLGYSSYGSKTEKVLSSLKGKEFYVVWITSEHNERKYTKIRVQYIEPVP